MVLLTTPYEDFLASRRSTQIISHTNIDSVQGNLFMATATTPQTIIIPPLNANLQFSFLPPLTLSNLLQATGDAETVAIPPYFNWAESNSKIIKPVSQGHCGCCWAVAIATCISDNFVTKGLIPDNPMLSYTYLLSCFPDSMQCGGGNPALCLQWIQKNGISPQSNAYDFGWCLENNLCSGKSGNAQVTPNELNQLIPPCSPPPLKFYIQSISTPILTEEQKDDADQRKASTDGIKRFLLSRGPVVGGFHVFSNFYSGNYTCGGDNPDNIYLEKVDYDKNVYTDVAFPLQGGHAVVITGWGTGKVKGRLLSPDYDPQQFYDVPYWIVRNSWGTAWGIDGYFRIAHYPINQQSQFDTTTFITETIRDSETNEYVLQKIPVGGMLFFETGYFGQEKPIESYQDIYDEGWVREGYLQVRENDSQAETISYFFICGMLLFLIFFTILVLCFVPKSSKQRNIKEDR